MDAHADMHGHCVECGAENALIALGERVDHPRRWRPWTATVTRIYVCGQCGTVVESAGVPRPQPGK